MKKFDIPKQYRSNFISRIKSLRIDSDPRKKDFTPTELDFGPIKFYLARHFGFCYGVENAIEIAYKTIEENPGRRIFLLSEMIHNPAVNGDLVERGIQFIMNTSGNQLIDWHELDSNDVVIIPAFGTTLETEKILNSIGLDTRTYDTTCPFVEKVWNRAAALGKQNHTIIIHGKHYHEETRATFSHSAANAPSVIVKEMEEVKTLCKIILGEINENEFYSIFDGKYSQGFDIRKDLDKVGVVNQTTMLASETEEIAEEVKKTMQEKFGIEYLKEHFADTRDTLCYATNDNQQATDSLLNVEADIAIVVGGYNSSNTSHIVELLSRNFSTFFISDESKILSSESILHFNINSKKEEKTNVFLPERLPARVVLTSGASCPDALVDQVLKKLLGYFKNTLDPEEVFYILNK